MRMYVGITDYDWFMTLKKANCDEVNFWKPGGRTSFRALEEGELFLFKLHSPRDYIVGGGFFLKFLSLPSSLAWEAFGIANGANSHLDLSNRIYKYKKTNRISDPDPQIGCIILSIPFYLDEEDWIPVPGNWSSSIVQGKTYDTSEYYGRLLYNQVHDKIYAQNYGDNIIKENSDYNRYGKEQIIKPRLG
ncbi:MAG: HNH endonuclease, partial [Gottschalkiaceae bacterium]